MKKRVSALCVLALVLQSAVQAAPAFAQFHARTVPSGAVTRTGVGAAVGTSVQVGGSVRGVEPLQVDATVLQGSLSPAALSLPTKIVPVSVLPSAFAAASGPSRKALPSVATNAVPAVSEAAKAVSGGVSSQEAKDPPEAADAELRRFYDAGSVRLPGGGEVDVWVERGASSEKVVRRLKSIPEGGILRVGGSNGALDLWHRESVVPVDYVVLDAEGKVAWIVPDVPALPPGTPWTRAEIYSVPWGRDVWTLPAGGARRLGLAVGGEVGRLAQPLSQTRPRAGVMAERILTEGSRGRKETLDYFKDHPRDWTSFEDILASLDRKTNRLARMRFLVSVFHEVYENNLPGNFFGMASRAEPGLWWAWVSRRGGSKAYLWGTPLRMLKTFVHESGHFLSTYGAGVRVLSFRVFPTGGGFISHPRVGNGIEEAIVSLAGPSIQFLSGLGLAAAGVFLLSGAQLWTIPMILAAAGLGIVGAYFLQGVVYGGSFDFANAAVSAEWRRLGYELQDLALLDNKRAYYKALLGVARSGWRDAARSRGVARAAAVALGGALDVMLLAFLMVPMMTASGLVLWPILEAARRLKL